MQRASFAPSPIPQGVADHFWAQAQARRALEQRLLALFRSWGYGDVLTPAFEFAETIDARANPELQSEIYRFVDRDGRMLALRADMTIPVARLVATRLHDVPMPQRFCYADSVFRYAELQAGQQREFLQAGIELVGAAEPASDAEVLALTLRAVQAAGIADVRLAVGHIGYFHALLDELQLPEAAALALFDAVDRNSDAALAAFLQQTSLPDAQRAVVAQLPHLSGDDYAALFALAERLCLNHAMAAALENLRAVLDALRAHAIAELVYLDLTEVHNLGYYTGITFEALTPGLGFALAGGGRYDHLVGTFGAPQPAVGAALTLDRLLLAAGTVNQPPAPLAVELLVQPHGSRAAMAMVEQLRAAGRRVTVEFGGAAGQELLHAARARGIPAVAEWRAGSLALSSTSGTEDALLSSLRAEVAALSPLAVAAHGR